jgi:hypothetical protein
VVASNGKTTAHPRFGASAVGKIGAVGAIGGHGRFVAGRRPTGRDLPGDEVAAVVVGGEVDQVVPAGAVALEEVLDALVGRNAGWVFVADEGDAGGRLDGWLPVVGRGPRVAVVVGVGAHRGADGVGDPEDHGVGEQVVFAEDGLDVAAVVASVHPAFQDPGQHPDR